MSDVQDFSEYIIKKHETVTDNPPIRIHANKIQNRITFKIKNDELLGSTKHKVSKDENGENVPYLESCLHLIQESCIHLFQINHLANYWIFQLKALYFLKPLIHSFHILNYGLLIKVLNLYR